MKHWPELYIEKLVTGGNGLARTDEGVVMVSGVCAGERVAAVQTGRTGGIEVASATDILAPSPSRRVPPCPLAGACGGCDWLHIDYPAQVEAKKEIFRESLARIGRIRELPAFEVFVSPEWEYRLRAQFRPERAVGKLGFFRRRSNEIIDVPRCPLLVPALNRILSVKEDVLPVLGPTADPLRTIAGDNCVVASAPVLPGLTHPQTTVSVGRFRFTVPGGGFFQGNVYLLETLGRWALPHCGRGAAVDMYGGVGFFSVLLGECFTECTLIETEESQAAMARANFVRNGLGGFAARAVSAETFLREEAVRAAALDCVIVDPPRAGLTRLVREGIADCGPRRLLYVSCNPPTQARDIGFFVNRCGYRIAAAALFDLYPQTHHLETAVVLRAGT